MVKRSTLSNNPNVPISSQLKASYRRLPNKALVRSAGPMSSLNAMLHWLSSYNLWAPVFLSVAFLLCAKHLCTNAHLETHSYTTVTLLIFYWQNAFLPTATLILQYILNQANRQQLLPSLRSEDLSGLKILRCYVVRAPYIPQVIGMELKKQPSEKITLRPKSSYHWPTYNDWHVQTSALLLRPPPGMDWRWTRFAITFECNRDLLQHLVKNKTVLALAW